MAKKYIVDLNLIGVITFCRLENMKILVVSPDATAICTSLEERHAIAIAATDIQEIPDLLNRVQPDAMLIDLTSLNDNEAHLLTTQVKLKQVEQKMAMVAIVLGNNSGERGRAFKMGLISDKLRKSRICQGERKWG